MLLYLATDMSQSYKKSCMYCNETIEMSDKASGNWYPYNMDGTPHDCRNQTKTGTKKVETTDKKPEGTPEQRAWIREIMEGPKIKELDERLKRVEALLFKDSMK